MKYQVLRVWVKSSSDKEDKDIEELFSLIEADLGGESLIVKARAI